MWGLGRQGSSTTTSHGCCCTERPLSTMERGHRFLLLTHRLPLMLLDGSTEPHSSLWWATHCPQPHATEGLAAMTGFSSSEARKGAQFLLSSVSALLPRVGILDSQQPYWYPCLALLLCAAITSAELSTGKHTARQLDGHWYRFCCVLFSNGERLGRASLVVTICSCKFSGRSAFKTAILSVVHRSREEKAAYLLSV